MKLAIITSRYPSDNDLYAHTFVHARSLFFEQAGTSVTVFVPAKKASHYQYQGVDVIKMDAREIAKAMDDYDVVYFHLLNIYPQPWKSGASVYKKVIKKHIPSAFYIHGSEVQTYFSRRFDSHFSLREMAKYLYKDWYFIPQMKGFVKALIQQNCQFITPSKWMEKEAQDQLKLPQLRALVIANGINTTLFSPKQPVDNKKLLCIRPLSTNKYAVDVAIKAMLHLPAFSLDIYGNGPKKQEFMSLVQTLGVGDRVRFKSEFIPHDDMPAVMAQYSYFMSPTRMDAQGVTMCEAIACGMIVVSSHNTAIPEFIEHNQNGLLGNTPEALAKAILSVEENKSTKQQISDNAVASMKKLDNHVVLQQELEILRGLSKKSTF